MKILFLDIDGVLNSTRTAIAFNGYGYDFSKSSMLKFDQVALTLIHRLVSETDCSVVLSSTWRMGRKPIETANGLDLPIIDHTPVLWGNGQVRGDEIKAWLDAHPEVSKYAIVDDDSDMLDDQKKFFVQTNGNNGLMFDDYTKLLELLS